MVKPQFLSLPVLNCSYATIAFPHTFSSQGFRTLLGNTSFGVQLAPYSYSLQLSQSIEQRKYSVTACGMSKGLFSNSTMELGSQFKSV